MRRAQTIPPDVDPLLASIQGNYAQFLKSLPDFQCDETIVSSEFVLGNTTQQRTVHSKFVGLQQRDGRYTFSERRELVAVNGKPALTGERLKGPFLFGGGFSSMLAETFAPENAHAQEYGLAGESRLAGRPVWVLEFVTKPDQRVLRYEVYGRSVFDRDKGKAWIDRDTLQILRIERHYMNVGPNEGPIVATVEFREVRIDGKPYWMPRRVQANQTFAGGRGSSKYVAEYSN